MAMGGDIETVGHIAAERCRATVRGVEHSEEVGKRGRKGFIWYRQNKKGRERRREVGMAFQRKSTTKKPQEEIR